MQRVGEKLGALRLRQGISLRDVTNRLGFQSYAQMALIECGEKTPSAEMILKIVEVFQVLLEQLMCDARDLDVSNDNTANTENTDEIS
ncbi:MAG: helix-turn-helix transcriptional regulator [Rhodospirillales bacterium]|nr:helix-turn-helix transcriptional regulator [Rhodospirillales bacterium]